MSGIYGVYRYDAAPVDSCWPERIGHRILLELPAFRECLITLEALPEVQDILDIPLLHRCLHDLAAEVDPGTTDGAGQILLS